MNILVNAGPCLARGERPMSGTTGAVGSIPLSSQSTVDDVAARYETMPIEDVHAELRAAGIDPAPTIAAVQQLIEASIAGETLPAAKPVARSSSSRPHGPAPQRNRSVRREPAP
jgi:hypothetical protein